MKKNLVRELRQLGLRSMYENYVVTSYSKGMGGQSDQLPNQVLADQLTLYQPEGTRFCPLITACPPSFRSKNEGLTRF